MEVEKLLLKELMILDMKAQDKEQAIDEMINKLFDEKIISDKSDFKNRILEREKQLSTALGEGIAIPHAKSPAVLKNVVLFAVSRNGIDFDSLDGEKTFVFFMIAAKDGEHNTHLEILSSISKMLSDEEICKSLKHIKEPQELHKIMNDIMQEDELTYVDDETEDEEKNKREKKPLILSITACPTGISHTYLARDALVNKAEELGLNLKVETRGSEGIGNAITQEDVEKAIGIIVAADRKLDLKMFENMDMIKCSVTDAIRNPEKLLERFMEKDTFSSYGFNFLEDSTFKTGIVKNFYDTLMNGISNVLPFVIGGGIFSSFAAMAARFLGIDHSLTVFFSQIGAIGLKMILPVLSGFIAMGVADRPGLLVGFVAGFMAQEGGSGFLGALIGGLIAGYVVIGLKRITRSVPNTLNGLKPMLIYPILGCFLTGMYMHFVAVPIFSGVNRGFLELLKNLSKEGSIIVGALVGAMMASDLGGPINKAAYTFSIAVFSDTGNAKFLASAMAGGMIPPLVTTFATLFFPKKFSKQERQTGAANLILGLSFIPEGAIPFALKEPAKVLSISVLASSIGGALTMFFGIGIPAPHGGIFVLPLLSLSKGLQFLFSVIISSIMGGFLYGLIRNRFNIILKLNKKLR